jgi:hypothetical protein
MRLFKSNKSQGSLQNISVGRSPLHSPIDSPLQSPAFPPPPSAAYGPGTAQYDESADTPDSQRYHSLDEPQARLGHFPSRAQSQNTQSPGYQGRPPVNFTPDQSDENRPLLLTAASAANQEERRPKKHIKSLFGLHSPKEHNPNPKVPTPTLGRSLSSRKKVPGLEGREGLISQSTPTQYPGEGYSSDTYEETESSNEYIPSQVTPEPDEQYYRQQNHFDSPQSHTSSHHSSHYQEEESQYSSQQTYRRTHPSRPPKSPSPYLPYNPQQDRPGLDICDPQPTIRPPSQQSLGPPSPILAAQQASEPRPSTIQVRTLNQPSQSSYLLSQAGMARGESNNSSIRMAQHPQGGEQGHGQSGGSQGPRQMQQHSSSMTDHRGSTPASSRNREEFNAQDYTALLQEHEKLRMSLRPFSS